MHITDEMMDPELRTTGKLIRLVLPYFKESTFKRARGLLKFMKFKPIEGVDFHEVYIKRPDGTFMRVCVYSPTEEKKNATGLLIHGGGYGLGRPEQDEAFIEKFVLQCGCVVVAPDYMLSTEKPYPAALEDCYLALLWMKKYADKYNIRQDQLVIGGDSAGGGLTAALAIYARDKKQVSVAFQVPLYPMLDDRMITPSSQNNDAPVWNTKSNESGWKLYLRDDYQSDSVSAYAAPARLKDFRGLPPAFTFVGSIEPFRDETIEYMQNLKKAGVPVSYKIIPGCYHAFDILVSKSTPAKAASAFMIEKFQYAQKNYFAEQPKSGKLKVKNSK